MAFMPKPKQPDTALKQVYSKKKPEKQQAMKCAECGMEGSCKCEEPELAKTLAKSKKK